MILYFIEEYTGCSLKTNPRLIPLFDQALQRINASRRIILASPRDPDADSCASLFSFREFLRQYGGTIEPIQDIVLYAPNRPEKNSLFNAYEALGDPPKDIQTSLADDHGELCIVFDYGNFSRILLPNQIIERLNFVGFDEHGENTGLPVGSIEIVDTESSSTTALLVHFFQHAGYVPTPEVATCLFTGIVADTGRFSHSVKGEGAFEVCAYLAKCGAKISQVLELSSEKISLKRLRIQDAVKTERVLMDEKLGFAFLWFSRDDLSRWNAEERDVLSVYGILRGVKEFRLVAAFQEKADGVWYCSLRSTNGLAKKIAVRFTGGGHPNAAGFIPPPIKPEELNRQLNEALREIT